MEGLNDVEGLNDDVCTIEERNALKQMLVGVYAINNEITGEDIPSSESIDNELKEILNDSGTFQENRGRGKASMPAEGGGARNKFRKKRGSSFIKTGGAKLVELRNATERADRIIETLHTISEQMIPILLTKQAEIDANKKGKNEEQWSSWLKGFFRVKKVNPGGENAIKILGAALGLLIKLTRPDQNFDITEDEIAGLIDYIPADFENREEIVRELTFGRLIIRTIHDDAEKNSNPASIEAVATANAASRLISMGSVGAAQALGVTGPDALNYALLSQKIDAIRSVELERLRLEQATIDANRQVALEGIKANEKIALKGMEAQERGQESALKAMQVINRDNKKAWLESLADVYGAQRMNIRMTYIIMVLGLSASLVAAYFSYNNGPLMALFGNLGDVLVSWSDVDLNQLYGSGVEWKSWLSMAPLQIMVNKILWAVGACFLKGFGYAVGRLLQGAAVTGSCAISFYIWVLIALGTIAVSKAWNLRSATVTAVSVSLNSGTDSPAIAHPPPPESQILAPEFKMPSPIQVPPAIFSPQRERREEGIVPGIMPPQAALSHLRGQHRMPASDPGRGGVVRRIQQIVDEPDSGANGGSRKRSALKRTRRKGKQPSKKLKRKSRRYVRRRQSTRRKN